jgi:hypothetical protein
MGRPETSKQGNPKKLRVHPGLSLCVNRGVWKNWRQAMTGNTTKNVWRRESYDRRRLLLLGESPYSWEEDGKVVPPSSTHSIQLVEGQIDGSWPNKFMNLLSRGLTRSENPTLPEVAAAWASVAFTNYIDETVGYGPDAPKTAKMWRRAEERFSALLADLKPRNIIVLGKLMWSKMPGCDVHLLDDLQAYRIPGSRNFAWCWAVHHPSRGGLSWQRLAKVIACAEAAREIIDTEAKPI